MKQSNERQYELQNNRNGQDSDPYQSSDKDSLSNEEELILGNDLIPEDNSAEEFNFDELMNVNENVMMQMLDPEFKEKQAKLKIQDIKTDIQQRKKQLQDIKNKKQKIEINPRNLKIGRMFIESFFAAMGDPSQMGIRETRKFLKKNNVNIQKKIKTGIEEAVSTESSREEIKQPLTPTRAEALSQRTLDGTQKQSQLQQTIATNCDISTKQLRLEKTVSKIKYFKELKTSANKAFFDDQIQAKQSYMKDMTNQGSYGSTTPNQIVDRKLNLTCYFLNEAVAFSLGRYLSKLNTVNLQQLTLHDNGLKDLASSQLLQGVSCSKALRKLHFSNNEIGPRTAAEILKMLLWTPPYNLDDLLLEDVNTTEFAMANIFEALKNAKKLRKLQLRRVKLNNPIIFDYLFTFVKQNKELTVLKLAWGSLLPIQISQLSKRIAVKKFMTHLDLSFNTISSQTGTDFDDGKPKDMEQDSKIINSFISSMRRLIVRSQLFHFNLTGMNLGAAVRKLVEPIRVAPCLNSVHLSQNCVPSEVIFYMDRALNVPDLDHPELKVTKFRDAEFGRNDFNRHEPKSVNLQTDQGAEPSFDQEKRTLAEKLALKIKANLQPKQEVFDQRPLIYQRVLDMPEFTFPNRFIVKKIPTHLNDYFFSKISAMITGKKFEPKSRGLQQTEYFSQKGYVRWTKLGFEEIINDAQEILVNLQHKIDQSKNQGLTQDEYNLKQRNNENNAVQNVHKRPKVFNEQCWVCDHRKQVLMVVQRDNLLLERWGKLVTDDAEIAKIKAKYLPEGQMPDIISQLPILVSSINGWFPCHLMPIVPFSMFFDPILAEELNGLKTQNVLNKVQQFEKAYRKIACHATSEELLPLDIVQQYTKIWRQTILGGLLYKDDTLFVDFPQQDEKIKPDQTYAFSTFVKPGNHKIFIFDPQTQSWYKRDIHVTEHSNDQPNVNYELRNEQKITVSSSIFKTRKLDSTAFFKDAFSIDESQWKVARLINKDPDDYKNCRSIVEKNFEKLKDVFISLAARSNFPSVELFTIQMFSNDIAIHDNLMINVSTIDRLFIAANVSVDSKPSESNQENVFVRYEFLEFLIRIADMKYKVTKVFSTVAQSLQKLLAEYILPFHAEYCHEQAQFRETYLLRNIIDHKICTNLKLFEHIYNQEIKLHPKKFFTREAASNVAWKLGLGMVESLITYCYSLSKLTVNDETNKQDLYRRMTLIEFCEFIARLVYLKSKFQRENISEQNQADTVLTMNKMQNKRLKSQFSISNPSSSKEIEEQVFDFSELLSTKMKAYAETQKGLNWIDGDQGSDDENENSNESDFLDTMDNNSEFKLTTTNRNNKNISEALQKTALPKESRLLITEQDLPKSFNKLLSNQLFTDDI